MSEYSGRFQSTQMLIGVEKWSLSENTDEDGLANIAAYVQTYLTRVVSIVRLERLAASQAPGAPSE